MRMLWPTRLVGREHSWAVLVGTSAHLPSSDLAPIPQAASSVEELQRVLTGQMGLFAKERVLTVIDPMTSGDVLAALDQIDSSPPDVVLFYYVGHGITAHLPDEHAAPEELFLALTGSIKKRNEGLRTALPVSSIFSRLRHMRAQAPVVVLDCCYSGRSLDASAVRDTHVLCATDRTSPALFELTDQHTGFTGCLLRLLNDGVPDGPEFLDLGTLFHYLSIIVPTTRCASADDPDGCLPRPLQRTSDHLSNLALVRNPAFGTALTSEGIEARRRFANSAAVLGRDVRLEPEKQRMFSSYANELLSQITEDVLTWHSTSS